MPRSTHEELVHFVSDMYSVELQALAQLVSAPGLAGDELLAADFEVHHEETKQQAELVRERLEALGGSPSRIKDAIMRLGGKGMLLFAKVQLETPGRLLTHAYSYEAMEWAGYGVLVRMAEELGDQTTAEMARRIQAQERTMMDRLEQRFDEVEEYSHRDLAAEKVADHIGKHLSEVHAFEAQSEALLKRAGDITSAGELARVYEQHLEETLAQAAAVEQRLQELGTSRSFLQDAALKLGGLEWSMFFQMQKDTPAKLAAFAYAVEHLEIGAYELLRRTAQRGGDLKTEQLCDRILLEERAMTDRISRSLDLSVQATLASVG